MYDEDRFRRLELRAVRKLANNMGVSRVRELNGAYLPGSRCRYLGTVMVPELGGLIVWCNGESGELLMRPWLRVMRELRVAQGGAARTTDPTRNATKNSTGKGGDTFPLPHETLWSEYLSTDVMQTLLGVDELTLHEYRWASGVFGWLRCKELYGDGSRDIVYAWSVLLDRVLGA